MKKLLFAAAVLIVSAGMLFAGGAAEPVSQDTLVYATTDKISDMDPANAYDFHTWEIFQNVGRGLLAYAPGTTDIIPGLAESYEANAAGDAYTFHLREGIEFSDGSAFTAEDVKWSIDRGIQLEGDPSWLITDFVESVDVVDTYTVRFNLKQPVGFFPSLVATPPYFPINSEDYPADHWVNDVSELKTGELSGLGPYKIVSFKRDEELILEANENYYGELPNIGRIVIRYYADATTMRLALENGEVDLVYKTLNPSDIQDLATNSAYNMFELDSPYIRYLCFETSEGVFADAELRQAVAALIDRPQVAQRVFFGQVNPLYSMVPDGMIFHTNDFKSELGDGNVRFADEILSSKGYSASNPFSFELWYTPSHYGDTEVNIAEVIAAQFEASDLVDVTIKSAEWSTYIDNWDTKTMPLFLLGWYPDYIDPDNYTAAFAGTSGSAGMGIYFSDSYWDGLFSREQSSPDPAVREDVFKELQMLWTEQVPTAPIFQGKLYVFTQPNVTGVKIGPSLIFNYDELEFTD